MSETLDISNVINISILSASAGLANANINTCALVSTETPDGWADDEDFRIYTNASDVITDFGSGSKAAAIAIAFFAQQPNVLTTGGYLVIILRDGSEDLPTTIARTIDSVYYFGVMLDEERTDGDIEAAAVYLQTIDKLFFYCSSDATKYAPTTGLFDIIRLASETHTRCLFYHTGTELDSQRFAAAYAGRALSTDFAGSNTTQTMHLKSLAGITPDQTVNQTQLLAIGAAGVDCYVSISGIACLFTSGLNAFFDEVYNELWLKGALQVAGFNYLKQTKTKTPQTETGMEGLKNQYRKVCEQAVRNGFAAPGAWNSADVFGDPASLIRCVADIGYYVFSLPISLQSQADREERKAPLVQIALKTAGAIHKSFVQVNINL